jgi:hypothetical protein
MASALSFLALKGRGLTRNLIKRKKLKKRYGTLKRMAGASNKEEVTRGDEFIARTTRRSVAAANFVSRACGVRRKTQ